MRLCLDEHYARHIASDLRDRGHDVECVKERPELVQLSDAELLSQMQGEQRALLTENVADFVPLLRTMAAARESHYGVAFTSPSSMPRSRNTIGLYVDTLDALMRANPGDRDFVDRVEWLAPGG